MTQKSFRMIAGIILHPVRILRANARKSRMEEEIQNKVRLSWHWKNWQRMHDMSTVTNTAYTSSELYKNLYHGAHF